VIVWNPFIQFDGGLPKPVGIRGKINSLPEPLSLLSALFTPSLPHPPLASFPLSLTALFPCASHQPLA
jgi:hypothetical protein